MEGKDGKEKEKARHKEEVNTDEEKGRGCT